MAIRVKFFASLRERYGGDEAEVELPAGATVTAVWQAATGEAEVPAHVLAAVNLDYAVADTPVSDGDEVGFFPPVTGG